MKKSIIQKSPENNPIMSADEMLKKATMDAVLEAWNANDHEAMRAVITQDMVRTENGNVVVKSAQEYTDGLMTTFFTGFPDFKVALDAYEIVGNKIYINWTCTGTNTGVFQGKTTNKPIKTHGMSVWTLEKDGKASREDAYYDNLILFQQLGYMPEIN